MTTMKTTIVFALIGVSFCLGENNDVHRCDAPLTGDSLNEKHCLQYALKHTPRLLKALEVVFCKYIDKQEERKEEFYEAVKLELKNLTACTGCTLDQVVGFSLTLEQIGYKLGVVTGEGAHDFAHFTEHLGISRPVASLVCIMIRGLFVLECLPKFKKNDRISNIAANKIYHEKKNDQSVIINALVDVGCIEREVLGSINNLESGTKFILNFVELNTPNLLSGIMVILGNIVRNLGSSLGNLIS
ncbi:uncharacterized protein ACMZJ9_011521 [Mantella aurantiaca]